MGDQFSPPFTFIYVVLFYVTCTDWTFNSIVLNWRKFVHTIIFLKEITFYINEVAITPLCLHTSAYVAFKLILFYLTLTSFNEWIISDKVQSSYSFGLVW